MSIKDEYMRGRPNRKEKTMKLGEGGRLYHIRADGKTKLVRRDKAISWAKRNVPQLVATIENVYDRADAEAARPGGTGTTYEEAVRTLLPLVPQTFGEAIVAYPYLDCEPHEWDDRTTPENAAYLIDVLLRLKLER